MSLVFTSGGGYERIRGKIECGSRARGEVSACGTNRGRGEVGRGGDVPVGKEGGREGRFNCKIGTFKVVVSITRRRGGGGREGGRVRKRYGETHV